MENDACRILVYTESGIGKLAATRPEAGLAGMTSFGRIFGSSPLRLSSYPLPSSPQILFPPFLFP